MIAKRGLFEVPEASQQEWLKTNGMGGFASSSIIGMNARRYHGLLTAALRPPVNRFVLLSKLEETLVVGENRYELSCNQYPGAIHPQGYIYLHEFRLNPFPTFVYRVENLELEKTFVWCAGRTPSSPSIVFATPAANGRSTPGPLLPYQHARCARRI